MSAAEKLLKLYGEYAECSDDDPVKIDRMNAFIDACSAASMSDSFNGQMPPECLQQYIQSQWLRGKRPPAE